ncbi:uracil-xanthine permease family protein [Congzhengia sp.]|uniref:uracil-xanthine permease family protein n=1 Tax=Congzhengia sp. TaxID=2944168 RepID=UPI0030787967
MSNETQTGIYDARTLGKGKMLLLGFQHMLAMFGATVLVPLLTGLDIATTLLMAGLGTLLFHLITKGKVPAFLGSSFAFLGGYGAVAPLAGNGTMTNAQLLPYACLGVAFAGLVYLILAALIKVVGIKRVMKFFPPVVTGPIIISIGLGLAGSAVTNCTTNWLIAFIALALVIVFNIWGKGMAKIVPILIGVLGSCAIAAILALTLGETITGADGNAYITLFGNPKLQLFSVSALDQLKNAPWIGIPVKWHNTVFGGIDWSNSSLVISSVIAIVPISLATMMEHIGDISAISSTVGTNFIAKPGLHRTLTGDGLATTLSALFGGPANTTYGENTGVLALSKVYDPRVIRLAAIFAVILSFSPKFAALVSVIPTAVIGGISFVLYGMISAIGVRNVVENKVDFTKSRNLIVAAIILVSALGLGTVTFMIGKLTISLSALAVASIAGIVLNAILPGKDYVFGDTPDETETGVNFEL